MATARLTKALNSIRNPKLLSPVTRRFTSIAAMQSENTSSSTATDSNNNNSRISDEGDVYVKSSSVAMPMSSMTGSIVGKRSYKKVTTSEADDGNGWNVMLDYRTLKAPTMRPLKLPTLALAKAIAAEWDYQQTDGIRPFTMPLMRLACTALERVPLTRFQIVTHLMKKFNEDLVFFRDPVTSGVYERQVKMLDPFLDWVQSEFGFKPLVYSGLLVGKQEEGLMKAIENLLKKANDCELAAIDALASAAHSLMIAIGIVRGKLDIEEAVELIRLEEDFQMEHYGLVEGGHDIDIADLRVRISSAAVFHGLSRT